MTPDTPLLKSYVCHNGKWYYVSTIERDSSAAEAYGLRYNETMAWEYEYATRIRGEMVAHTGDGPAFSQHSSVVKQLYETGTWKDPRDE